jgi:hypothetical protein
VILRRLARPHYAIEFLLLRLPRYAQFCPRGFPPTTHGFVQQATSRVVYAWVQRLEHIVFQNLALDGWESAISDTK